MNDCPLVCMDGFLTARGESLEKDDIRLRRMSIVRKIRFADGKIELRDTHETRTKLILVMPGDIVISGINAAKGAIGYYDESNEMPIAATIHYSSYSVDRTKVDSEYLWQYMRSQQFRSRLLEVQSDGIKTEVRPDRLLNLSIPLPPLSEQSRIMVALRTQEKEFATTKSNTSMMISKAGVLKDSLIMQALKGELIATGKDCEPPLELVRKAHSAHSPKLQRIMKERCANIKHEECFKIPDGWIWTYLGDLLVEARYGTSEKCTYEDKGTPVLRIPNVVSGFSLSDLKYTQLSDKEIERLRLNEGDILVVRTNGSLSLIGKAADVPRLDNDYAFASYLIRLRPVMAYPLSDYLALVMQSAIGRKSIESRARTTAGQYNINLGILTSIPVPLPPVNVMKRIVILCKKICTFCDHIDTTSHLILDNINVLERYASFVIFD